MKSRLLLIAGIITAGIMPVMFLIAVVRNIVNAAPLPPLGFDLVWIVVPIIGSMMIVISFLYKAGVFTKKRQYAILRIFVLGSLVFAIGFGLFFTGIFYTVDQNIQSIYCEINGDSKQEQMLHHGKCIEFTVEKDEDFIKRNLGTLQ